MYLGRVRIIWLLWFIDACGDFLDVVSDETMRAKHDTQTCHAWIATCCVREHVVKRVDECYKVKSMAICVSECWTPRS